MVKWDYELRNPTQIVDVVARAHEVSDGTSARAGLSRRCRASRCLPRCREPVGPVKPRPLAAAAHPDPKSVAQLAEWLATAERPLIIAATLPNEAVPALAQSRRALRHSGITHNAAHGVPAVEPPDAFRFRAGHAAR